MNTSAGFPSRAGDWQRRLSESGAISSIHVELRLLKGPLNLQASLDELVSYFIPNGYGFYDERTEKRRPSEAKELQRLIADGESMNVIARVG
jgi:hypothetical protein